MTHSPPLPVELEKVSRNLQSAGTSLDTAIKKLHTGKGNLVKRALDIQTLGAKTSKKLPDAFLEQADDVDEELAMPADAGPDDASEDLPDA
jgi:DNA anti-recombination protein RmuC